MPLININQIFSRSAALAFYQTLMNRISEESAIHIDSFIFSADWFTGQHQHTNNFLISREIRLNLQLIEKMNLSLAEELRTL